MTEQNESNTPESEETRSRGLWVASAVCAVTSISSLLGPAQARPASPAHQFDGLGDALGAVAIGVLLGIAAVVLACIAWIRGSGRKGSR